MTNVDSETVWRALASPHRRKILDLLRDGPRTTGDLHREMSTMSRFAVMQHLQVLVEASLVLVRREGRQRFNFANPVPLREVYERWVEPRSSSAAESALHLKRYAERIQEAKRMENEYRHVRIELELRIKAPRERVFAAMTTEYDNWWPHRYKPDSTVSCDARAGGRFEEKFKDGGGAIYGDIVYYDPPFKLATSGMSALTKGFSAYTTDTFEADGEETILKRHFRLWGNVPEELEKMFREGARDAYESALNAYLVDGVRYSKVKP